MSQAPLAPSEVARNVIEAFNRRDYDQALSFISPDAIDHAALPGLEGGGLEAWRKKWQAMNAIFGDLQIIIENSVQEGEFACDRYTMRGKLIGNFMGISGTGQSFEIAAFDMIRVRDGKIIEHWSIADMSGLRASVRGG